MLSFEAGRTGDTWGALGGASTITSYGGGIRWQVTADKKLNPGVDVGISGTNRALYVQVGEKF